MQREIAKITCVFKRAGFYDFSCIKIFCEIAGRKNLLQTEILA